VRLMHYVLYWLSITASQSLSRGVSLAIIFNLSYACILDLDYLAKFSNYSVSLAYLRSERKILLHTETTWNKNVMIKTNIDVDEINVAMYWLSAVISIFIIYLIKWLNNMTKKCSSKNRSSCWTSCFRFNCMFPSAMTNKHLFLFSINFCNILVFL
jgi:NADH:ubiquinone oxidoreductase subunit 4 (subunit M)